jgi:DNA-binding MarR family transcriptional regulator
MTTETSLLAYATVIETLGERQLQVLKVIDRLEPCNNTMIAEEMNLPISSITPRVGELRRKKMVTLAKVEECPRTHHKTMFWKRVRK